MSPSSGWLGALDNQQEGQWTTVDNVEYISPWSPDAPTGSGDCMAVLDGSLVDDKCENRLIHAICSKSPGEDSVSDEQIICKPTWRYHQGQLYKKN